MRTWFLKAGDPCTLVLSADFRFCEPNYINDHTWEMEPGIGDTAVMGVRTTYGLRARTMRIFISFTLNGKKVTNPDKFFSPPRLQHFYPNFLEFAFSPFQGLDARAEYWLPSSQTLASRLTFRNQTTDTLNLQMEVCGFLTPMDGQSLAPTKIQSVNVLAGKTSDLEPVVFLTGGPVHGPGPYSSLLLDIKLAPLASRKFTWVQAALPEVQASFDLARRTAARSWDAERARLMLVNASQTVDVETGDPDWDAALAFSQTTALRLFFKSSEHLPQPSFVLARQPDHGYSLRGDGRDHASLWSGQTALDAIYLASMLPGAPGLAAGLVRNFLSTQDEKGFVDSRPGLAGQRGCWLAAPHLADLAWNTYRQTGDKEFLQEVFPGLLAFIKSWSDPSHDRDGDGFPEWDHPLQTGFEENPAFNSMQRGDQGADIRYFESPALAACLWREYRSLGSMAHELDLPGDADALNAQAQVLWSAVDACWNKKSAFYQYRDRDTHLSVNGRPVLTHSGPGIFKLKSVFKQPVRLLIRVWAASQTTRGMDVRIHGQSSAGSVIERLERKDFRWNAEVATATSCQLYSSLEEIEVTGLQRIDNLVVRSLDYTQEDQTGFLPLWAGITDEGKATALIQQKLFDPHSFWHAAGFSTRSLAANLEMKEENLEVQFPWNQLIGEGLLEYGRRSEASQLVGRLMETAIRSLKQQGVFFNSYLAKSGTGQGERNSLRGLAPLGLFLKTLGVQIISPRCVRLEGTNPFPWPVTIKFRGLIVMRQTGITDVTFPDGQSVQVTDPAACLVSNS